MVVDLLEKQTPARVTASGQTTPRSPSCVQQSGIERIWLWQDPQIFGADRHMDQSAIKLLSASHLWWLCEECVLRVHVQK